MELKEFVKVALLQITEGVKEAQSECIKHGGLINPMLQTPRTYTKTKIEIDDKYYPVTVVDFKVGLTEISGTENKKAIGVFLSSISLGAQQTKDKEYQSITSIEFSVNVVFPFLKKDGKPIDLDAIATMFY